MTISKGSSYGTPTELPEDAAWASTDADLAALLRNEKQVSAAGGDSARVLVGLSGGDLYQSLGGAPAPGNQSHGYPVDLGWCQLDDGSSHWFAAHLVGRGRLWAGPGMVAMNATQYTPTNGYIARLGSKSPWNLGPRAHPNDGLLDITVGSLSARQMLLARARLPLGTHLPHPDLAVKRTASWCHRFNRPRLVFADGKHIGQSSTITVGVRPDAGVVVLLQEPSSEG